MIQMIKLFKKFFWILMIMTVMVGCSQGDPVFHDMKGNTIQRSQLKGKWVVVNYWAAWCPSCVQEVPELNDFYKHTKNKNVVMFGVNFDQLQKAELKQAVSSLNIQFPVLVEDPNPYWSLGDINVLPTTFILNPQGKVVKTLYGGNTEEGLMDALRAAQSEK
jgi:peroxiredoxin